MKKMAKRDSGCGSFRRLSAGILLALTVMMLMASAAMAKDVSNNDTKPKMIKINKMYSSKFEKKNDRDCYAFKSTGGSYELWLYDQSGRKGEKLKDAAFSDKCIDIMYGAYEKFSPAAGAKPVYMMGATMHSRFIPEVVDGKYKTYSITDLDKYKKRKQVGIILTGKYKGKYKFKVVKKK